LEPVFFIAGVESDDLPLAVAQVEIARLLSQGGQNYIKITASATVVIVVHMSRMCGSNLLHDALRPLPLRCPNQRRARPLRRPADRAENYWCPCAG
jgi:hypothetical protein